MRKLKILNKKQIKSILEKVNKQWGAELKTDCAFLMSPKNKIYIVDKDISKIDMSKLRINNIGLYFGEIAKNNELRLSIEGSQIVGKNAKNNVVEVNKKQAKQWFRGEDIEVKQQGNAFVILKHENDFLGCGRLVNGKVLNYVAKARRIQSLT